MSGPAAQRLPMEQFLVLREEGQRFGPHRSHALIRPAGIKSKAPPFKERRTGHPQIPNQRPGHPPATRRPPERSISKAAPPAVYMKVAATEATEKRGTRKLAGS